MRREGLTASMVILAESANYGEGIGNITTLKKMNRGNYKQYSYISRQAMRYNIMQQAKWDNTPVDNKNKVVQFAPSATIKDYPEIDLFGYMKTTAKENDEKGGAATRSAVVRLSNAISLEPFESNTEFLTNMGLAQRAGLPNVVAPRESPRAYYACAISIDLDRVGIDGEIEISQEEKAQRIKTFLDTLQYLYRDIKGRRENLSPLFMIGGRYERKNPFFENRIKIEKNNICIPPLQELISGEKELQEYTRSGVVTDIFDNDQKIKSELQATTIGNVFSYLKKEVEEYYAGN